MVVLAAAILTKSGKPLLSRQFVEMSRIRIEGLLAAFPKLLGSGKQYTYLETDTVRYVYQPIETLFLGMPHVRCPGRVGRKLGAQVGLTPLR